MKSKIYFHQNSKRKTKFTCYTVWTKKLNSGRNIYKFEKKNTKQKTTLLKLCIKYSFHKLLGHLISFFFVVMTVSWLIHFLFHLRSMICMEWGVEGPFLIVLVYSWRNNPIFAKQRNLYWSEITFSAQLHSTFFLSSNIPKSITSTLFPNSLVWYFP